MCSIFIFAVFHLIPYEWFVYNVTLFMANLHENGDDFVPEWTSSRAKKNRLHKGTPLGNPSGKQYYLGQTDPVLLSLSLSPPPSPPTFSLSYRWRLFTWNFFYPGISFHSLFGTGIRSSQDELIPPESRVIKRKEIARY